MSSRRDDAIRNLKTLVFDDDEHRVSARLRPAPPRMTWRAFYCRLAPLPTMYDMGAAATRQPKELEGTRAAVTHDQEAHGCRND